MNKSSISVYELFMNKEIYEIRDPSQRQRISKNRNLNWSIIYFVEILDFNVPVDKLKIVTLAEEVILTVVILS